MADYLNYVSGAFWSESFWFPPGVTWQKMSTRTNAQERYPEFSDMYLPFGYAFIILIIRTIFEWTIARPLGRYFGCKGSPGSQLPNVFWRLLSWITGEHYESKSNQKLHQSNGPNPRPIRRSTPPPSFPMPKSALDKFCECCWRFTFYLFSFTYGITMLWNKHWFWDTAHCWLGYPYHTIDDDLWWYYEFEISFYWALMMSQFVDTHRKDFAMNMVHHLATIALMWFSWVANCTRMGCLVLVLHDAADFWLEGAKMARYAKYANVCNAFFGVFTLVWFTTRLGIFPTRILYSTFIEAPALINWFNVYYVLNGLMLVLLTLNVLWSIMILRIVVNTVQSGEADDVRSDDEDSDTENDYHAKKSRSK